ncbi:unnamed protein product [Amaranthus hypochondriacus]
MALPLSRWERKEVGKMAGTASASHYSQFLEFSGTMGFSMIGEQGHWKNDCPKKKKQQDKSGSVALAEENTNSRDDFVLVADEQTRQPDVWVLDLGASYHICPRREWFTTYAQIDGGNVSMANTAVCKAVGIGSIKIRTHDGKFCTLNDVLLGL